jgi:hypothetical protein
MGIKKAFTFSQMDANAQMIIALTKQNLELREEVESLKLQLASSPTKGKKTKKDIDPNKPKNPRHIETGKRLALWNTNRKLCRSAFQAWVTLVKSE